MSRTSTRCNLKFFFTRVLNKRHPEKLHFTVFSPKRLVQLFILMEVEPSSDSKRIELPHLITCSRHYDILAKTRSRMTSAITFSRKNDAGSRVSNTRYWEISYSFSSQNLKLCTSSNPTSSPGFSPTSPC